MDGGFGISRWVDGCVSGMDRQGRVSKLVEDQ